MSASRTARIIGDLRTFSHPGNEAFQSFDLHESLDEREFLRKSIGPTGLLALKPLQVTSYRDDWHRYLLKQADVRAQIRDHQARVQAQIKEQQTRIRERLRPPKRQG